MATEIAERTRHEQARARLAALVESCDDAIIGESLEGIIESWNTGAARLYGYTAREAVGRHIDMLAPPDRAGEIARLLSQVRRGKPLTHYDTVRVRKDGTRVDVSLSISPIRIASGRIIGASTIARDIGDRLRSQQKIKLARTQAEALAQLHADFVTSVSHELRTPLTCIVGYTELLSSKWSDLPDARRLDYIRRVADAAHRQLRVIEELLVAGSLEADQLAEIYPVGWYGAHSRHMTS
jgi:two-component system sensor histidine kinase/response regulator